jgi:serine/threonine protein kinase/WD40 repeat protein
MTTSDATRDRDAFEALAEEFVERYRRGERPAIAEYAAQHPELAGRIERLFPTLLAIELALPTDPAVAGAAHRSPLTTPLACEQLGDFRIIRELGRGGMGVVYEAEQQSLGRRVALKVLGTPSLIDGQRRERFLREARTAARLHHTNIVPVYGIGEERGVCYYAMQLIVGRGLDEVLEELRRLRDELDDGSVPSSDSSIIRTVGSSGSTGRSEQTYWAGVARIGLQVADALAYAHDQGLVHRDIKPSNLLLDVHGNIWVTDFGLAKADEDGDLTRSGDIIGTLRYMAPERLQGHADARSDVYSLGLTLYELVTMRPAFGSVDRSTLIHQVTHQQPIRPRRINPHVPADLETVILKCIARDPAERYRRAENLAADLRCVLENRPIEARRTPVLERVWRWGRRNPTVAALAACVVLLLGVLAALGTHTTWRLSRQNEVIRHNLQRAQDAELEARRQADLAHQAEAAQRAMGLTANRQLYASYLDQAAAQRGSRRPGQRTAALQAVRAADAVADEIQIAGAERHRLNDEAAAALAQFDLTPQESWPDELPPTSQNRVAFSPDGTLFARAEPGRQLVVRRLVDGQVVHSIALHDVLEDDRPRPFFSPDERYLLAKGARIDGSNQIVGIWKRDGDVAPTLVARIELGGTRFDQALDIAPDSSSFVGLNRQDLLEVRGLPSGELVSTLSLSAPPDGVRFSPDGQRLLVWNGENVEILALSSGQTLTRFRLPARLDCAAWRNDGRVVAGGGEDGHIYLVDVRHGNVRRQCVGHQSEVREVSWHPYVDLLASSSWDGTVRLWDLRHGQEVLRTTGALGAFSRCGRWLGYTATQSVGRWAVSPVPWTSVLAEDHQTIRTARFNRDGTLLFAGGQQGISVWNARNGRHLALIAGVADLSDHPVLPGWCTAGAGGVVFWPQRRDGSCLVVGPPEVLLPFPCDSIQIDPSGSSWLVTSGTDVMHWTGAPSEKPAEAQLQRWRQPRLRFAELSPDGRWISTSGWNVPGISVWAAKRPAPVTQLPAPRGGWVAFSHDNQWLGVSLLDQYLFYRTETWQSVYGFPSRAPQFGALAWAPDGRSLAVVPEPGKLQILDFPAGIPRLTIELAAGELIASLTFSPDGRRLAAGMRGGAIHLWDLDLLRAELAALQLNESPAGGKVELDERGDLLDAVQIVGENEARREEDR